MEGRMNEKEEGKAYWKGDRTKFVKLNAEWKERNRGEKLRK
jgi:hypothetical protein